MAPLFRNRTEAGQVLGGLVSRAVSDANARVLALPRGGVPVGLEVARALHAKLDIFLVRKLGLPGHEELAIGAIASGGVQVLNQDLVAELGVPEEVIGRLAAREQNELERRERLYRGTRPPVEVRDRTVVLVDDGLATGATMKAAAKALRAQGPREIVVAVPVASQEASGDLQHLADKVICAETPEPFVAVGAWYQDFAQITDQEVQRLLSQAEHESTDAAAN
jgi:putative phosphoribosyl transferase